MSGIVEKELRRLEKELRQSCFRILNDPNKKASSHNALFFLECFSVLIVRFYFKNLKKLDEYERAKVVRKKLLDEMKYFNIYRRTLYVFRRIRKRNRRSS